MVYPFRALSGREYPASSHRGPKASLLGVFHKRGKARVIDRVEPVTAMPGISLFLTTLFMLTHPLT